MAQPRYHRKIIRITAEDSPNVQFARAQIAAGLKPTDDIILPGVLSWGDLQYRLKTWDIVRQTIGLHGMFWEGKDQLLYPPTWLDVAAKWARLYLKRQTVRVARALGIDSAAGGDKTCWTAVDEFGIIEQKARKTPNTKEVRDVTIAMGGRYGIEPHNWIFDAGGGGREHADQLRSEGYLGVRTIAFGEAVTPPPRMGVQMLEKRESEREVKYAFKNRRAQMAWQVRERLDPNSDKFEHRFAIPDILIELRRQLALIPYRRDGEGRLWLPPKNRKVQKSVNGKTEETLFDLLGCSPDEMDSLMLAVHGMTHQVDADEFVAGAV